LSGCFLDARIERLNPTHVTSRELPPGSNTPTPSKPTVSFSNIAQVVNEASGTTIVQVSLSQISDVDVSVDLSTKGSAGTPGDVIASLSSPIVIPAGHLAAQISIQIVDDSDIEPWEELILTLNSSTNEVLGIASHAIKILDNDNGPISVFRSIGPSNISALASGGITSISIQNSIASFQENLPSNIGVGDVVQYDSDNDGLYDAIGFISVRLDSNRFYLQTSNGGSAIGTTAPSLTWKVYRAYTSLSDAQSGTENTGILSGASCNLSCASLANFDTRTTGTDLVAGNLIYNFAGYADATDNTNVDLANWVTNNSHYIKIFAPNNLFEAGQSQRHQGFWASGGYELSNTTSSYYPTLNVNSEDVRVEGIKISQGIDSGVEVVRVAASTAAGTFYFDSCIVTRTVSTFIGGAINAIYVNSGGNINFRNFISNSIFYGVNNASNPGTTLVLNSTTVFYNNTILTANEGVIFYGPAIAKNNIVQGATANAYSYYDSFVGDYNLANTVFTYFSSSSTNDVVSASVHFMNASSDDYRLRLTDVSAKGRGVDLSADANFAFISDIQGITRSSPWDIGASGVSP
tara:strand:+ start:3156 stop:4886 length:1731 start_codon:yes stop_codon:yes gene_type:complete